MAKLISKHLTLEIRYKELDAENWVQYDILFLYDGEPMISDALMRRDNAFWANRSAGAFKGNEFDGDSLIPVIQKTLDTNQPAFWEPTEPDVILAFYPKQIFPFMPHDWTLIKSSPEFDQMVEDQQLLEEITGGRLANDPFTLIAFVDAYNLRGEHYGYSGEGPALIMVPTRYELGQFLLELRIEYEAFCQKYGIQPKEPPDESAEPPNLDDLLSL